jgi:hypothetical protein
MPDADAAARRFDAIAAELLDVQGVIRGSGRRGFGADALTVGGRIFAMVSHGRIVLKLPAPRVAQLIEARDGAPFDAGKGPPMREWVTLEPKSSRRWSALAREAMAFVAGRSD